MALQPQVQAYMNSGLSRRSLGREVVALIDGGASAPTAKQERYLRTAMASKWAAASEVVSFLTTRPATGSLTSQAKRDLRIGLGRKSAGDEVDTVITTT